MGADVIKVEPPDGDAMRYLTSIAPDESRVYAAINPGKRAITLDLTSADSRPAVDRLLGWADIALIGVKRADLARFSLEWQRIHAVNERLVVLSFNAYGPEGPDAELGGYDMLAQAVSGLGWSMDRTTDDGAPISTRPAFIDFASGSVACAGVLAALRHRDLTGIGQRVDASLLGSALTMGTPMFSHFEHDQETSEEVIADIAMLRESGVDFATQRRHYESRVLAPGGLFELFVRVYQTSDGLISVSGFSPGLRAKFYDVIGAGPLPEGSRPGDPGFDAVIDAADALFASKTTEQSTAMLRAVGYPCIRFNHPLEALANPQAEANDYVVDLTHPDFGGYRTIGMPFRFSKTPAAIKGRSPKLGEHNDEVANELGW